MPEAQRPLELILARNLMSNLGTPAVLTDEAGALVFYNEAAAALLGRPFDDAEELGNEVWRGIASSAGNGAATDEGDGPLELAVRHGAPAQSRMRLRSFDGTVHDVDVTALPIVSAEGPRGAIAFVWPRLDG